MKPDQFILLISDGSHDLNEFSENLRSKGFPLRWATNPEAGREIVRRERPDILFLCFHSPVQASDYYDGLIEEVDSSRGGSLSAPTLLQAILLCTNVDAHIAAKLALEYKVNDYYVFKPAFDPNRLYLSIQHALDRRENHAQATALKQKLAQYRASLEAAEHSMNETIKKNAELQDESDRSREKLLRSIEEKLNQFEQKMSSPEFSEAVHVIDSVKLNQHFSHLKEKEIQQHFETFSKESANSQRLLLAELKAYIKKHQQKETISAMAPVRILIIDDDPKSLELLKAMLQPIGHMVLSADNTKQAVALALKHEPDIILMDVMMPGVNGIELTRRFRNHPQLKSTPIVIITAHASKEVIQLSAKVGASDFISKPVRLPVLAEKIRRFCPGS